jgi:hypothetical protein
MVVDRIACNFIGLLGFGEADELNGGNSALMQKLKEAMLSVGAGFAEIDRCGFPGHNFSFVCDPFAVGFHVELLDVGGELAQGLAVGDDGASWVAQDRVVVETDESQHQGDVFLGWGWGTWMVVSVRRWVSIEWAPSRKARAVG